MTRPTSATRSSRPTRTPGLPCEEYRPYLDARYHAAFDEFLAERHANRDEQMKLNYDYITNWETDARGRAARRVRRRAARQGDGRRRRRRRGDLPRRRRDHRHGVAAVRRRACRPGMIEDPELAFAGARAHNRFLVELCATSPQRRAGVGLVPITHDVDARGRRDRVARRQARASAGS